MIVGDRKEVRLAENQGFRLRENFAQSKVACSQLVVSSKGHLVCQQTGSLSCNTPDGRSSGASVTYRLASGHPGYSSIVVHEKLEITKSGSKVPERAA